MIHSTSDVVYCLALAKLFACLICAFSPERKFCPQYGQNLNFNGEELPHVHSQYFESDKYATFAHDFAKYLFFDTGAVAAMYSAQVLVLIYNIFVHIRVSEAIKIYVFSEYIQ